MTFTMDKPVHKVLEDYDLLNVSVIQNTNTINMTAAMLWKMNLCAVSDEIPCTFFVAMNYRVNVYTLDTIYSRFKDPVKTLVSPQARQTGGGSESPFIINYIKIGKLLQKEVLVTCSENGEVCIYRTENLDEPPMILNNGAATWGIAIHADQGLVAVSANSWRITVYNILEMTKSNPILGKRSNRHTTNILGTEASIELSGHEHNIPCIDFNETGRYLASASIDQTCRVWDLKTRQVISQRNHARQNPTIDQDSWCWSVKFIKPGNFKFALCVDKNISKAYLQRLYQGKPTSLVNLGLCHSAASPVFPMSVSNVYDLGDEVIDFSIYEVDESEMDDNAWDDALLQEEDDAMEEIYEGQRQDDAYIYNHGEIQQEQQPDHTNSQSTEEEEEIDDANNDGETYDEEEEEEIGPVISYAESEVDNEIQSEYNFNLSRREGLLESRQELPESHESEELIQQREVGALEEQDEDYLEDEEFEDAETDHVREGIEVWTTPPAPLPTQEDWARTIESPEEQNRDGWGDEIIPATQGENSTANAHSVNVHTEAVRTVLSDRLQAQIMNLEDVASFMNNRIGWDSNDNNNVDNTMEEEDGESTTSSNQSGSTGTSSSGNSNGSNDTQQHRRPRPYCIPNIIRSTSSSRMLAERHYIEEKKKKLHHHTVGEYLMISTGKDVMLMSTSTPKMNRIRAEHGLINKVDVRSDQMLNVLDRINMVEWLPELELYVAASQKGTVALLRLLQVEFEGGEQACIFNNECYLPTSVLQSTPLYGMTVQKVVGERFTAISYQIFLFYYSGNVLGYSVSRKDSDLLVENLIF